MISTLRLPLFAVAVSLVTSLHAAPVKEADVVAEIDRLVLVDLEKEGLNPNPDASDEIFVRRVYLDLIGRTPTKAEALAFLKSEDDNKRASLVDSLIGSDGYVSHQYNWLADVLRLRTVISGNNQSLGAGLAYERFLKTSIRENKPWNTLVYELVTASGSSWENPAIGYYLRDFGMPLDNLAVTTQIFLGTQIVCAQCHDHPFDSWTQLDYYQLAAFTYGMNATNFHPVQRQAFQLAATQQKKSNQEDGSQKKKGRKRKDSSDPSPALRRAASEILFPLRYNNVEISERRLRLPRDYKYEDARPLSQVQPLTLFGNAAVLSENEPPIHAFGEWMTSPENPRFTKTIVNRLWKRAFGVALIEPVDDFKESIQPANPALMDYLTEVMTELGYDLQAFNRILYKTQAYQRESSLEEITPGVPYHFPGPILRRMTAEQIWDSLVAMTIENPDRPDPERSLLADQKLAAVQLIGEAIYDQSPAQFLKNLRAVVKIQSELSERIDVAVAKIAEAREHGDDDLIKQATKEVNRIKKDLKVQIEEVVYRDGLKKKLTSLEKSSPPAIELASKSLETEDQSSAKPSAEQTSSLIDELASKLLAANDSFDEGMMELIGEDHQDGIIAELVDAIFRERVGALEEERYAELVQKRTEWDVQNKNERLAFRNFSRGPAKSMRRASEINQPAPAGHFLREFGQSDRELIENSSDEASITQALAMLNGPTLSAVTNRYSVLMRELKGKAFAKRLDTIYLAMLSRYPTQAERKLYREAWDADPESGSITGIVWTLLNTRQFLFNQ